MSLAGILMACQGGDPASDGGDAGVDDPLRLNHLQVQGTHNSYHVAPADPLLDEFAYTHPGLTDQLEAGIRQFELDIHPGPDDFAVYHIPGIDDGTRCATLSACLGEIERWSASHPRHHPLFIFIEPKFSGRADIERIDPRVESAWPRARIVTPDDVRGGHADLRTALAADGWPTIESTRGKALFFLFDDDLPRDRYVDGDPSLSGRLLFPRVGRDELDAPFAVFGMRDEVDEALFAEMLERRMLVRTRADDATNRARAIEAGAHMLSFDHPDRWPGGSRCNPVTAPPTCDSSLLEDP